MSSVCTLQGAVCGWALVQTVALRDALLPPDSQFFQSDGLCTSLTAASSLEAVNRSKQLFLDFVK